MIKARRRSVLLPGAGWLFLSALGPHGTLAAATAPDSTASDAAAAVAFTAPTTSSPIAISADDKLVWSVNPGDDSVSVIRTDTNTVVRRIVVGDEPQAVALAPDNTFAFVANAASSNVTVIRITNPSVNNFTAAVAATLRTGAEPWNIVISPDGKRVFVANSAQDTITVINALTRTIVGQVNLRNSLCNDPDRKRHFQPRGMAVSLDNTRLYVTRFISFTKPGGKQATDDGREGLVCRLNINTNATNIAGYQPARAIKLAPGNTGFAIDSTNDGVPDPTRAFANQLQSAVIRGNRLFMPNIAASPNSPLQFQNSTEAFVTVVRNISGVEEDRGALNLHLGARNPEPGKKKLFFANPWAIAFTTQGGAGNAYAVSAGSDLLVKLNVSAQDTLSFTVDSDTTRYIDLNDPNNPATRGNNAGKNPRGIAINSTGTRAYVMNRVSRNVSVVNLQQDRVIAVVRTQALAPPGSQAEKNLVGAEMFFSSRGHFDPIPGVVTDERLSSEGWQNCASCHFEGLTDGVVWDFNAGPRKSISMGGTFNPKNRNQQRILNYSAQRDRPQDFELNIRTVSGPGNLVTPITCSAPPPDTSIFDPNHGLLLGDVIRRQPPCVINDLFLKDNENRTQVTVTLPGSAVKVKALDALKDWIKFAIRAPNGPLTDQEISGGVPSAQVQQGRNLFRTAGCTNCHNGGLWTDAIVDFAPPPDPDEISCERDINVDALQGCAKDPVIGNPVAAQFIDRLLEDVGSFNLGVVGQGNPIGNNIGALETAAQVVVAGKSAPPQDALGIDYNDDDKGVGFSTQSLLGIHGVPPYMHNGACETIACVVSDREHRTGNGRFPDRLANPAQQALVTRFVESIDPATTPF
jgi:YVTN family beta-propeller protein